MPAFWNDTPSEYHHALHEISLELNKNKDEYLFSEGESFRGFYIVESGRFRIFTGNASGNEATLSIMEKGAVISAVPILADLPAYHADCQAMEDSRVIFFDKNTFKKLMLAKPELMQNFVLQVSRQFLNIRDKYLSVILKNAEERFLEYLLRSERHFEFSELNISKKNIASLLDVTPESLSRIIKKLQKSGKIELSDHKIKIIPNP